MDKLSYFTPSSKKQNDSKGGINGRGKIAKIYSCKPEFVQEEMLKN